MNDAWLTLLSTLAGGAVGISGSYLVELRKDRTARADRWEQRKLDAVVELSVAAQNYEGAHYRRGRTLRENNGSDDHASRITQATDATSELWAAATTTELLCPDLMVEVSALRTAARDLRDTADTGLETRDPRWIAARDAHQEAIRAIHGRFQQRVGNQQAAQQRLHRRTR